MALQRKVSVGISALPDSDEDAAKVTEVLSRAAVGLAMDGIPSDLRVVPYEHDPDEEEED